MSAYQKRLDNFFANYAPEKRSIIPTLLEKYKGNEEQLIESLVKKFGPEPTVSLRPDDNNSVSTPQRSSKTPSERNETNHRERLIRFYTKYAPQKLFTVDSTLAKYSGREEELFFKLVKRYGSCASNLDTMSMSTESASDTQSLFNGSNSPGPSRSYQVDDVRWRLARLFMLYAPEKIPIVDQMLETYAGKEEEMMSRTVGKLGMEPPSPNIQTPRERLLHFLEYYTPKKTTKLDAMLDKHGENIEGLFGVLVYKFGAEPPPPFPESGLPKPTYRQRLIRFYKMYAREKLANVEALLRRYKGNEDEMFLILTQKYGPEPDPDFDVDAPIPPEKDYLARLSRLFSLYAPERLESVPSLLVKYKGREQDIIEALTKKLGPEPVPDTPVDQSPSQVKESQPEDVATASDVSNLPEDGENMNSVQSGLNAEGNKDEDTELGTFFHQLRLPLSAYRKYAAVVLGEEKVVLLERMFDIPRRKLSGGNSEEKSHSDLDPSSTTNTATISATTTTTTTTKMPLNGSAKVVDGGVESSLEWNSAAEENISANFSCLLLILECVDFPISENYNEALVFQGYPLCTVLTERDRFTLQSATALHALISEFDKFTQELFSNEIVARQQLSQSIYPWRGKTVRREEKEAYAMRLLSCAIEILPCLETKERQELESIERIEVMGKAKWFQQGLGATTETNFDLLTTMRRQEPHRWKTHDAMLDSPTPLRSSLRHFPLSPSLPLRAKSYMDPLMRHQSLTEYYCTAKEGADSTDKHRILSSDAEHIFHHNVNASPLPKNPFSPKKNPYRVLGMSHSKVSCTSFKPLTSILKSHTPSKGLANGDRSGRDKWGPGIDGRLSSIAPSLPQDAREAIMLNEPQTTDTAVEAAEGFLCTPFFFKGEK